MTCTTRDVIIQASIIHAAHLFHEQENDFTLFDVREKMERFDSQITHSDSRNGISHELTIMTPPIDMPNTQFH